MITKVFWDTWKNCSRNKMINNTKSMPCPLALLTPKTFPESTPMYKVSSWKTSWTKLAQVRGSGRQPCDRRRRIHRIWHPCHWRIFSWFPLFLSKFWAKFFQPIWSKINQLLAKQTKIVKLGKVSFGILELGYVIWVQRVLECGNWVRWVGWSELWNNFVMWYLLELGKVSFRILK